MFKSAKTQRRIVHQSKLQQLNLHRGRIIFIFRGLAGRAKVDYDLRQYGSRSVYQKLECIRQLAKEVENELVYLLDDKILEEKQRINDAMKEILNEPDAGN